jgi:hypothetical protein
MGQLDLVFMAVSHNMPLNYVRFASRVYFPVWKAGF